MSNVKMPKGSRVMHIKRGNLELVFPINLQGFASVPAYELAEAIVPTMLREQLLAPGRADEPIPQDGTQLALRVHGRDEALDPNLSLREQTEGCWAIRELPLQAQGESTARLPVCEFELVNVQRPAIYVA